MLFSFLQRVCVWVSRFRYRRGYGVHSPFAFRLIKEVIYERGTYYAYASLAQRHKRLKNARSQRDLRLLFRLANAHLAQRCYLVANDEELVKAYLSAARPHMVYATTEEEAKEADLVVLLTHDWEAYLHPLLPFATDRTLYIIGSLQGQQRAAWKRLLAEEAARVTFDLYDFGLVFCSTALNRQHYLVNRAF